MTFASKREAQRYATLRLLERAGQIANLECQPRFELVINGYKIGRYTADFRYQDLRTSSVVVEDVKSSATKTRDYRLRTKLLYALHGITVSEIE